MQDFPDSVIIEPLRFHDAVVDLFIWHGSFQSSFTFLGARTFHTSLCSSVHQEGMEHTRPLFHSEDVAVSFALKLGFLSRRDGLFRWYDTASGSNTRYRKEIVHGIVSLNEKHIHYSIIQYWKVVVFIIFVLADKVLHQPRKG